MQRVRTIRLRYTQERPAIQMRELTGNEEMSVRDTTTSSAIGLINSLLVPCGLSAEKIVTADRDTVLAMIYIDAFGPKIEGKSKCRECNASFEIGFRLPDLQSHIENSGQPSLSESGVYYVNECGFRLPTGEDELAIADLDAEQGIQELFRLCVVKGDEAKVQEIQQAMSEVAPMLQTEIKTVCPDCSTSQQSRFDMQSYLLTKLKEEQKQVLRDVHRLASAYKWGHNEIIELPRRLRRSYVKIIEDELS